MPILSKIFADIRCWSSKKGYETIFQIRVTSFIHCINEKVIWAYINTQRSIILKGSKYVGCNPSRLREWYIAFFFLIEVPADDFTNDSYLVFSYLFYFYLFKVSWGHWYIPILWFSSSYLQITFIIFKQYSISYILVVFIFYKIINLQVHPFFFFFAS